MTLTVKTLVAERHHLALLAAAYHQILVPAFVASELTRAFEIGFLLYLPFLIIDVVVANVLMTLGMIMVSPTLISIPLKLLLFVAIDGWSRLMHGLILSYN